MMTGGLFWQWIGGHLPGCGGGGGLGVSAVFLFGALRLGCLWHINMGVSVNDCGRYSC